jgi:hypothetical protein
MGNRLNRINIDLGQYKQPWVAYCRARNESPSALFRQLAAQLLVCTAKVAQAPHAPGKIRKEIRLTLEEQQHVAIAALQIGMSEVRWITALIRAHMASTPTGQVECEALGRSNLRLVGDWAQPEPPGAGGEYG